MSALEQFVVSGLVVKPQAFEAAVFGAPVWRLETPEAVLDAGDLRRLLAQARRDGIALIVVRLPAGDSSAGTLQVAGFRLIERLVTFRRDIPEAAVPVAGVLLARRDEAEPCAVIARHAFSFDRFHADPQVPNKIADEIKSHWARNGVEGRADAPLVARENGDVVGFNLCMKRGADAVIDLIAVERGRRGMGIGRKLVDGALAHFAGEVRTMFVSTQEANTASIRLYRACGFEPQSAAQTWHWTP